MSIPGSILATEYTICKVELLHFANAVSNCTWVFITTLPISASTCGKVFQAGAGQRAYLHMYIYPYVRSDRYESHSERFSISDWAVVRVSGEWRVAISESCVLHKF